MKTPQSLTCCWLHTCTITVRTVLFQCEPTITILIEMFEKQNNEQASHQEILGSKSAFLLLKKRKMGCTGTYDPSLGGQEVPEVMCVFQHTPDADESHNQFPRNVHVK